MTPTDPLAGSSAPQVHWTTTNVGEAAPGVLTPLTWSVWEGTVDLGLLHSAYGLGAITAAERDSATEPLTGVFAGRFAVLVEFIAMLGDRMPGTSGPEAVTAALGRVPETIEFEPTRRRYPIVAYRFPLTYRSIPRRLEQMRADHELWWRDSVGAVERSDGGSARRILADAAERFEQAVILQSVATLVGVQPVYDAVARLTDRFGGEASALTGVPGGVEMNLVAALWEASNGHRTVEAVVAEHGFHGPGEGELSSAVWRIDPSPLERTISLYSGREDPRTDANVADRQRAAEAELIRSAPAAARPLVRAVMRQVRARVPLRGVAKRSYLQAFDVARAAARRLAELHDADLSASDDVFYLTVPELTAPKLPDGLAELVAFRRGRRAYYESGDIPEAWRGEPVLSPRARQHLPVTDDLVTGVGVSPGVAEGRARVVLSPDFGEVEPDEILIAPFTDPSWSSIMFVCSALVVDIGGALSHAAVVAREMGIPCVVNTRTGTRAITSGDHVRVDGSTGQVQILERRQPRS